MQHVQELQLSCVHVQLAHIEQEVQALKEMVERLQESWQASRPPVALGGLAAGGNVSEEDLAEAKAWVTGKLKHLEKGFSTDD